MRVESQTVLRGMLLCLVVIAVFYWGLRACDSFSRTRILRRETISSTPPRLTGRDLLHLPNGESCVVFQIPPVGPKRSLDHPESWIPAIDGFVEIYQEPPESYWYGMIDERKCLPTLNCASYALGPIVGLTANDYLATDASPATNDQNPTRQLLTAMCQLKESYSEAAWPEATRNWKHGDIVCYYDSISDLYLHLCIVDLSEREMRFVGKLGAGPVIRSSIDFLDRLYQGRFDMVQVYRPRG